MVPRRHRVLRLGRAEQQHGVFDILADRLLVTALGEQQAFGPLMQRTWRSSVLQKARASASAKRRLLAGELV